MFFFFSNVVHVTYNLGSDHYEFLLCIVIILINKDVKGRDTTSAKCSTLFDMHHSEQN